MNPIRNTNRNPIHALLCVFATIAIQKNVRDTAVAH